MFDSQDVILTTVTSQLLIATSDTFVEAMSSLSATNKYIEPPSLFHTRTFRSLPNLNSLASTSRQSRSDVN